MVYVVKMPKLGLEMDQGTLLDWHVREGDTVEEGETIAEVESEKSIGEVDAREDGVLRLIGLEEGATVPPGTPIGIVAGLDEDITDQKAEFDTDEGATETGDSTVDGDEAATASESTGREVDAGGDGGEPESTDVKASPRAKRLAAERKIDLTGVDGTGPQGAITAADVEAAADSGAETQTATEQVKASPRAERRADELGVDLTAVDGSGPQGAIAVEDVEDAAETPSEGSPAEDEAAITTGTERATASAERYDTTTLVTHGDEADSLIKAAEMTANAFDFDVSPIDVLLVAVSVALGERPEFNATFADNTHHLHEHQNIAFTIDAEGKTDDSVRSAVDERTFADLVEARHDRAGQEPTDDASRKPTTFALASGEIDDEVRNVVTPPTVAGLVVDCSRQRAIPAENGVRFRRYLRLSLAYDTRAVGDRCAEAFLETLLNHIEEAPELILQTYR